MDDQPTQLWKLRRERDEVACQVRLAPYGIEVDIVNNGTVVLTRVFETDAQALGWATEKRSTRESQGFVLAPPEPPPAQFRPA